MYLHIGGEDIVPNKEVIAIIDYEAIKKSEASREFLQIAELEGVLEKTMSDDKIKSCIITDQKIYLSSISAGTLLRRSKK